MTNAADIVDRIRSLRYVHVPVASQLFEEAACEIERLRGAAVRDNCVSDNLPEMPCPVTEPMPKEKRAEVSGTLTDAERDDLACAESRLRSDPNGPRDIQVADTICGLLERLGGGK